MEGTYLQRQLSYCRIIFAVTLVLPTFWISLSSNLGWTKGKKNLQNNMSYLQWHHIWKVVKLGWMLFAVCFTCCLASSYMWWSFVKSNFNLRILWGSSSRKVREQGKELTEGHWALAFDLKISLPVYALYKLLVWSQQFSVGLS